MAVRRSSGLAAALTRDHALSRNLFLLAGLAATAVAIIVGLRHPAAFWLLLLSIPTLAVSLLDLIQMQHSLRRNYPASARFRWFFEWLRPFVRSYIVESDLDGRPFSQDERALVYARAKGDVAAHPFGTELDVYSDEYEWLAHSIALRSLADRLGISHVVLLSLHERLHVRRRDQLHIVTEPPNLTRPMMRAAARLHSDRATGQLSEEAK